MDTDEKSCWHSIVQRIKSFCIYFRNSKSVFIRVYPWFKLLFANRSATGQLLQLFGIPSPLHFYL